MPPTPGPGTYSPTLSQSGPLFTANARKSLSPKATPGPGEYEPKIKSVQKKGEEYKVGTSKRIMLKELISNPGPGQHAHFSQLAGPKFVMGSEKRK